MASGGDHTTSFIELTANIVSAYVSNDSEQATDRLQVMGLRIHALGIVAIPVQRVGAHGVLQRGDAVGRPHWSSPRMR